MTQCHWEIWTGKRKVRVHICCTQCWECLTKALKKMEDFILATDCHFNRTLCAQDRMIDLFHFCLHGTFRVRPHLKSTLLFLPVFWILVFWNLLSDDRTIHHKHCSVPRVLKDSCLWQSKRMTTAMQTGRFKASCLEQVAVSDVGAHISVHQPRLARSYLSRDRVATHHLLESCVVFVSSSFSWSLMLLCLPSQNWNQTDHILTLCCDSSSTPNFWGRPCPIEDDLSFIILMVSFNSASISLSNSSSLDDSRSPVKYSQMSFYFWSRAPCKSTSTSLELLGVSSSSLSSSASQGITVFQEQVHGSLGRPTQSTNFWMSV